MSSPTSEEKLYLLYMDRTVFPNYTRTLENTQLINELGKNKKKNSLISNQFIFRTSTGNEASTMT